MNAKDCSFRTYIFLKQFYPELKTIFPQIRTVLGSTENPKNLYIIKDKYGFRAEFSNLKLNYLMSNEDFIDSKSEIIFHSVCLGPDYLHDHNEISDFLNSRLDHTHYSHHLINQLSKDEESIIDLCCDKNGIETETEDDQILKDEMEKIIERRQVWGLDLIDSITRVACHYTMKYFFKNSITIIRELDYDCLGDEMIEFVAQIAIAAHIVDENKVLRLMSKECEQYGKELVIICHEKSNFFYRHMLERFDADTQCYRLLKGETFAVY